MHTTTQRYRKRRQEIRFYVAAFTFMLGTVPSVASATTQELTQQQLETLLPQIERYIETSMKAWQVPGLALGIVAEDKLLHAKGYGVRQMGSGEPVNADTLFQIGSATKAFLGVTEALLVDRGKLKWSDKVIDHYPEFQLADPWVTREFEIADLLAQRSGLPYSTLTNMMLYDYSRTDVIKALQHVQPVSSFRSLFAYQNGFHLVAGKIVARTANVDTWENFLQTEVLDALGMTSSNYHAKAIEHAKNRASGHRTEGEHKIVVDPWAPFPYNAGGAGNLNSNVNDMSRWLRFQINLGQIDGKRIISSDVLAETHIPRIAVTGPLRGLMQHGKHDDMAYATGWIIHSTPEGRVIEHGGGTAGYTSHVAFDPDRRFGIVILTNLSADIGTGLALPLGKYITDVLQGRTPPDYADAMLKQMRQNRAERAASFKPPANARAPRPMVDYVGMYNSPTLGDVAVTGGGGKLSFKLGPRAIPVELTPWSGDVFVATATLPAYGPNPFQEVKKLRFLTDAEDRIAGFEWIDESDGSGQPPFWRKNKKPAN